MMKDCRDTAQRTQSKPESEMTTGFDGFQSTVLSGAEGRQTETSGTSHASRSHEFSPRSRLNEFPVLMVYFHAKVGAFAATERVVILSL